MSSSTGHPQPVNTGHAALPLVVIMIKEVAQSSVNADIETDLLTAAKPSKALAVVNALINFIARYRLYHIK